MPYYRRGYNYGRRRYRGGYRRYTQLAKPFRPLGGLPGRHATRLRYVAGFTLNAAAGSISLSRFRCNSVWAPQQTGGHQPAGFDTLTQMYNKSTVLSSKISVVQTSNVSAAINPGIWGLHIELDTASPSDVTAAHAAGLNNAVMELNRTKWQRTVSGQPDKEGRLTMHASMKSLFREQSLFTSDEYEADNVSVPIKQAWFTLWLMSVDNVNDPGEQHFTANVDYLVVWHDPKNAVKS